MLWAKLVGSPYAHAKIKSIKYDEALKVPGVVAVFTGKDFPFKVGIYAADRDVLAIDKVIHYGQPVAAVVAETLEAAEKAAELIEVEYEPLPTVFDILDALKPDAPILHEKLGEYRHAPFIYPMPGTNIANHLKLRKGDVEEGFSKADVVVEKEYKEPLISQGYLETWSGVARVRRDGTVEVWSSHQSPFAVRNLLALSLGLPIHKVIVHHIYIGGGFGGKAGLLLEHIPVLFAMKLGRPVRLELNREENFIYMAQRAGFVFKMKTGATKDGKIIAHWGEYYLDAGAYADYTVNVSRSVGYKPTGPYEVPNIAVDTYAVYTNKIPTTAFRGFGMQEMHFAFEQQVDIIARKLGIDPVELRLKNVLIPGKSLTATQEKLREDAGDPAGVIKEVAKMIEWGKPSEKPDKPWKFRGKGIAAFFKGPVQPPNAASSAIIKVNDDGSVDVLVGTGEMGQGTITALVQIVSEELGIPPEKVRISPHRTTDMVAYTWQTVGSRGLFSEGQAVLRALDDLKNQIKEVASQVFRVHKNLIVIKDGKACVEGEPWKCITLAEMALGYMYPNGNTIWGPLIGRGSYAPAANTLLDPETGKGVPAPFYTFGAGGVEVEVDLLTGRVKIIKAALALDASVINPALAEGQAYGGIVMGLNIALLEELKFDKNGRLLNPNFTDYKLARTGDLPEKMEVKFLGVPQEDAPFGAKGIGELTMIPWPAAVANAIYDAIGIQMDELPMSPDRIIAAVRKQRPDLLEKIKEYLKISS
jgi:carbon-monoxide dehydrogenase large subunit